MALFFNLENLERESGNNSLRFMQLLNYHYSRSVPKSKFTLPKTTLTGSSFILNPRPLFHLPDDIGHVIQYIKLCGLRDYTLYKYHKAAYLDTSFFPDLARANLNANKLITFKNNLIYFKYEEIYNGTKIQ